MDKRSQRGAGDAMDARVFKGHTWVLLVCSLNVPVQKDKPVMFDRMMGGVI